MVTPPSFPSPESTPSPSMMKRTRKATRLRSLSSKPVGLERALVHVDPTIKKIMVPKKEIKDLFGGHRLRQGGCYIC